MTNYIFNTHAVVPEELVRDIVSDYVSKLLTNLTCADLALKDEQIYLISKHMDKVADLVCKDCRASVDGYHLDSKQVLEIANYLRDGKKISAIKAFRSNTGAGLKNAKDFIDTFCEQANRQSGPVSAVKFAMAFGR